MSIEGKETDYLKASLGENTGQTHIENNVLQEPPPAYRIDPTEEKMDCFDIFIFTGYSIFWVFINLCPIIAQIKLIYTLCHYDKYYRSPDPFQNKLNVTARYLNTYLVGHLVWNYFKFVGDNFSSETKWKKYLARSMCGFIIVDGYVFLFKYFFHISRDCFKV